MAGIVLGLLAGPLWAQEAGIPPLAVVLGAIRPVGRALHQSVVDGGDPASSPPPCFAGIAKLGNLRMVGPPRRAHPDLLLREPRLLGVVLGFVVGGIIIPPRRGHAGSTGSPAYRAGPLIRDVIQRAARKAFPRARQFIVQLVPANPFKAAGGRKSASR